MKRFSQKIKEAWKFILLVFLIALTFSYAMFEGGFGSWFLFYSFLPFALYSICLAFYPLTDFLVERNFNQKVFNSGEKATITHVFNRKLPFPLLYLVVEEQLEGTITLNGDEKLAKKLIYPWFKKKLQVQYSIEKLRRGEHRFKGIRIKTGDPFGIIEKETYISIEDKIIVYPAYDEMIYSPKNSQFDLGTEATNEQIHRDTTMSVGVREYQPGDRFSWINWKATARRDEFMTKEFEQRKSYAVMLLMDCAPDPHFETTVTFTASMVRSILKTGVQLGLITLSDERFRSQIRGGQSHHHQLFYHLAKIQCKCTLSFDQVIAREDVQAGQNHTMMLVTASISEELIDTLASNASRSGKRILFIMKAKHEIISEAERHLTSIARAKGIQVTFIHEGHFAESVSEVSGG